MEVEARSIPFSPHVSEALALAGALSAALTGGDDYQFLFTVDPAKIGDFLAAAAVQNVKVTRIGSVLPAGSRPPVVIRDLEGVDLEGAPGSYSHF
ncbi:MAG: thiamine-phosphate kinase, partial [Nitratireductor sp.]|nr:thiamine-phosphate kinase [Nitratireductor sp.]